MQPVDLRIQIVNYRTKRFLVECLDTLAMGIRAMPETCSVAVLDNASGDDLRDLADRVPGLPLEIHYGKTNIGFGAGHNLLARHGSARFLLLLNPDTRLLRSETLRRLLRRARESEAQVVGLRLVSDDGHTHRWDHGELEGWLARLAARTGNSYWRDRAGSDPVPAAWVSGAVFLIDKTWFDDLGGFDEAFFLYKEEEELCLRLRQRGGRVLYDPSETVHHHVGAVAVKSEHLRASTDYFLEKHFSSRPGYALLKMINALLH